MTDFWIWVDTVSGVILPNIDWHIIYIHHEAILDIYLFGIIVVFGVLCFLGLVWWIVIDPCIRFFFRMPHLKCKIRSDQYFSACMAEGLVKGPWSAFGLGWAAFRVRYITYNLR